MLWIINLKDNSQKLIDTEVVSDLSWKPNGTKIAYTRYQDDTYFETDIYVADLITTFKQNLTNNPGSDSRPIFSPDGEYIIFVSARGGGIVSLWKMNEQGGDVKQITNIGLKGGMGREPTSFIPVPLSTRVFLWVNGKIIYDSGDGIWAINDNGSNAKVLIKDGIQLQRLKEGSGIIYYKDFSGKINILNIK